MSAPLTEQDYAAMTAAREKRERKLAKYTNTPEARKRLAGTQWFWDEWGSDYFFPTPWIPEGVDS